MATASRSESSSPTFRMWCTVPRGTHTISSRVAWTRLPPVSSHSSRPANTTHHSSNSRCQCGRFPPPGGLAISVTSWRSSAMIRRDHGAGPICATTAAIRVWRTLGHVVLAAWGGVGPVASSLMTIVAGDGSGEGISEDIAPQRQACQGRETGARGSETLPARRVSLAHAPRRPCHRGDDPGWLWAFEAATAGGNDGPGRLRLVLALLPPD